MTFETDKFSTYTMIYKDTVITENNIGEGSDGGTGSGEMGDSDDVSSGSGKTEENVDSSSKEHAVNTGDKTNIQLYIIGTIMSVAIIMNRRRKFQRMKK